MSKPFDIPEGFEELLGSAKKGDVSIQPIAPKRGMTTEQLIENMKHNLKIKK
jgi:hypothetical protein